MRKLVLVYLVVAMLVPVGLFANDVDWDRHERSSLARREYLSARDQVAESFARQLYGYERDRDNGTMMMTYGVVGGIIALVVGSTALTLATAELLDPTVAQYINYGAYGIGITAGVSFGFGHRHWTRATNAYLDTLRLQTQYYNLIDY